MTQVTYGGFAGAPVIGPAFSQLSPLVQFYEPHIKRTVRMRRSIVRLMGSTRRKKKSCDWQPSRFRAQKVAVPVACRVCLSHQSSIKPECGVVSNSARCCRLKSSVSTQIDRSSGRQLVIRSRLFTLSGFSFRTTLEWLRRYIEVTIDLTHLL